MIVRNVQNFLCKSKFSRTDQDRTLAMHVRRVLYHTSPEESQEEQFYPSEWCEKAFLKLTKWSLLLKDIDLVGERLVNVNDQSKVFSEKLEHKMHDFKSVARAFIGCPSVQEIMKKNVNDLLKDTRFGQLSFFSKLSERESMTVNSLTTVANFLNVSAQQKKVVRHNICPQVTRHQIWAGALQEILNELKSEIDFLNHHLGQSKETMLAEQIVAGCLRLLENSFSYDPESTSWMRLVPAKAAEAPTSHTWEDVVEMFVDLTDCLSEKSELALPVMKLEVMKEGLYQIRDISIGKNTGYREKRGQEYLAQKKLTKTLGHSSKCLFTLLLFYLYGNVRDIEVDVCGGVYPIGKEKFLLCMGKILTSDEEKMVWYGVKQLDKALGLFKFVWEVAGIKGNLELQGHMWSVGAENKSFTYRGKTFMMHGISI